MKRIKIDDWRVISHGADPYMAPELQTRLVQGKVYRHPDPKFPDGSTITTSRITGFKGRTFDTYSGGDGHQYVLGKIDPLYRKWIKIKQVPFNWRKPFDHIVRSKGV